MKVSYFLLISLLIVGMLFIPAVSAETIIDETFKVDIDTSYSHSFPRASSVYEKISVKKIRFWHIEDHTQMYYVDIIGYPHGGSWPDHEFLPEGRHETTYTLGGQTKDAVIYVTNTRDLLGKVTSTKFTIFFDDWDIGYLVGAQDVTLGTALFRSASTSDAASKSDTVQLFGSTYSNYNGLQAKYDLLVTSALTWQNHLEVTLNDDKAYEISLNRNLLIRSSPSTITGYHDRDIVFTNQSAADFFTVIGQASMNMINVSAPSGAFVFSRSLDTPGDPGDPGDPTDPVLRTGTVTMTDHNGTSISGFEVTAVNHYTGESYTVTTDTDVAVIDLPMDRTIEIRNPQTGEYEEVSIGYYKFYGQAHGYKMLLEDGIQVTVVPEKYSSYQLCNILVTSESGPLTGKHKFQIRSRADNSILQTGTISAKSATTGEWYNTTVSGGIATLILAYDTTSILSEYAGLYYVYATSPGFEDNDYGTQISVYPRTVSEIRTVLLTPIGGVSPPDNVTLRIQAVSETGTGVVNAEIFIAGVYGTGKDVWNTYTTSSTGYLEISVPGNSTYDIVASGDGYYDSARRVEVFTDDPGLIEIKLYLSGYPTLEPPTQPTGWPTDPPSTQPTGGIPDEDDDSDGFLVQAVRGIGLAFGVGFSTAKIIFGMLLALSIGFTTAKKLRGGAAEFGMGLLGGTMLGVLIGLLPVWIIVVLLLVVGLYVGNRYIGGNNFG